MPAPVFMKLVILFDGEEFLSKISDGLNRLCHSVPIFFSSSHIALRIISLRNFISLSD